MISVEVGLVLVQSLLRHQQLTMQSLPTKNASDRIYRVVNWLRIGH